MSSALATTEKRSAPQMSELMPYDHGPALKDATLTDSGLSLTWQDGTQTTLPLLWFRDHCACQACRHPQTRERLYLPLDDIEQAPSVTLADGHLYLQWHDGHDSAFHSGWLYQRRPKATRVSSLPNPTRGAMTFSQSAFAMPIS